MTSDTDGDTIENGDEALDPSRVSRRSMIRAALAGSGAAVAWSAPRVVGFSVAPDFAAAASCVSASPSNTVNNQRASNGNSCGEKPNSESCCIMCWNSTGMATSCVNNGYYGNNDCNSGARSCGNSTNQRLNGSLNIAKTNPTGTNITMNYNIWGPIDKTDFGDNVGLSFNISGIDPPFQSCKVSLTGSCDNGAFFFHNSCNSATNLTLPATGSYTADTTVNQFLCTSNSTTLALSPGCRSTNNANNNNCTSNASLVIQLQCTCT